MPETTPMPTSVQPHHAGGGAEQREHPQQAVDARLDHHAAHHGRDVRRRGRMGLGQPDVHRHEAGLRAEADHGQQEERAGQRRPRAKAGRNRANRHRAPSSTNIASRKAVPRCMATRYVQPARHASLFVSNITRKNDASDIIPSRRGTARRCGPRRPATCWRPAIEEEPRGG